MARLHPDRNPDSDAGQQFAALTNLFEATLSDDEKRKAYDNTASDGAAELTKRTRELTMREASSK